MKLREIYYGIPYDFKPRFFGATRNRKRFHRWVNQLLARGYGVQY